MQAQIASAECVSHTGTEKLPVQPPQISYNHHIEPGTGKQTAQQQNNAYNQAYHTNHSVITQQSGQQTPAVQRQNGQQIKNTPPETQHEQGGVQF